MAPQQLDGLDRRGLALGLYIASRVLLVVGGIAVVAAVTGLTGLAGGLWYGAVAGTLGMFAGAAERVVAARELEQRDVIVPSPPRPLTEESWLDGEVIPDLSPLIGNSAAVNLTEQECRFAGMVSKQTNARGEFGRGG